MTPKSAGVAVDPVTCCAPVRSPRFDDEQAEVIASVFAALADPIRLRLFAHVASAGDAEVCACDLPAVVDRSQPTISHHMKILFEAGLISRDKRGLWVWYRVVPERLDALRAVLA